MITEAIGGPAIDLMNCRLHLSGYPAKLLTTWMPSRDEGYGLTTNLHGLDVFYPAVLSLFLASLLNRLFKLNNAQGHLQVFAFRSFLRNAMVHYAENTMVLLYDY